MKKSDNKSIEKHITESIPQYFFAYNYKTDKIVHLSDTFTNYIKDEKGTDLEKIKDTIHPVYQLAFDALFTEIRSGNLEQDVDLRTHDEKNNLRWINIKTYPINHHKVAGQVIDITASKDREKKLQNKSDRFEIMLHLLTHDLRSPVGNITEFSKLIDKSIDKGNLIEAAMYNEIVQRLSSETIDILDSLTQMLEIDSKDFILKRKAINLKDLIEQIVEGYSIRYERKNIEFSCELPENAYEVEGDVTKIRLVFQNLISNAIKFTREAGKIHIYHIKDDDKVVVCVKDNGIGIPKNHLSSIFKQFTPVKRKGTKGEKSVGLGLSITKNIIELHNGTIEVDSEDGKGTTFTVSLPMKKAQSEKVEVLKRKLN